MKGEVLSLRQRCEGLEEEKKGLEMMMASKDDFLWTLLVLGTRQDEELSSLRDRLLEKEDALHACQHVLVDREEEQKSLSDCLHREKEEHLSEVKSECDIIRSTLETSHELQLLRLNEEHRLQLKSARNDSDARLEVLEENLTGQTELSKQMLLVLTTERDDAIKRADDAIRNEKEKNF